MIVSFKDAFKLIGITIVCALAAFVSTFFLNFYADVVNLRPSVAENMLPIYDAQLTLAQFTVSITGGCLGLIAAVMVVFYVRLYISSHIKQLGILKAMGYSKLKISLGFFVFGLSVLAGVAIGFCTAYAAMPLIYESLVVEGMEVEIGFHVWILAAIVVAPTAFYSLFSIVCAYFSLGLPVGEMLRGGKRSNKKFKAGRESEKERSFIADMRSNTIKSGKLLAFFVAFSAFCFSAMVQMSFSMRELASETMWLLILGIGLALAFTSMAMAVTSCIRGNIKNIAVMKAFGYNRGEYSRAVLGAFRPFAWVGFGVGTLYQFGLLSLMVNVIFKDVGEITEYSFDVPVFLCTLAAFIVLYECAMYFCSFIMAKTPVKEIMLEN